MLDIKEPRPAATVVLIRDGDAGLETLMLKRNKALLFAGGVWVFPGGALEADDWQQSEGLEEKAARFAAVREAYEESGLTVNPDDLVPISHWTTPEAEPWRYYTWFFLAESGDAEDVIIDGSEIHDHAWMDVNNAIALHEAGELGLFPPTVMTLKILQNFSTVSEALAGVAAREPYTVLPVFANGGDQVQVFYPGDVAYDSADPELEGAQHRSILQDGCWHYVCEIETMDAPRLDR